MEDMTFVLTIIIILIAFIITSNVIKGGKR